MGDNTGREPGQFHHMHNDVLCVVCSRIIVQYVTNSWGGAWEQGYSTVVTTFNSG